MALSREYTPMYAMHTHMDDIRRAWGECSACDMLTRAEANEANEKDGRALEGAKYIDGGIVRWDKRIYNREQRGV